jgi:phosphoribosylformylglycinamidine synthase
LLETVDLASRRWIYEQYDSQVMADTLQGPGGDAGLIRVHGSQRGLAMSTDCTPRYVEADPRNGGAQAVAEAYRNICAVGARPLAITNNLNFGNPEKPEIMTQMAQSLVGMGEAALALDTPVVSGNVSLYNETDGRAIRPCPVVGMVGVIDDIATAVGMAPTASGQTLMVIGQDEGCNDGWLGASLYARHLAGEPQAAPPPVTLEAERKAGEFLQSQIGAGTIIAAHDVSDGGLAVAIAEMCMAAGLGATIASPDGGNAHGWAFGEDQGRYVIATDDARAVTAAAKAADVGICVLGVISATDELKFDDGDAISVLKMKTCAEATIPALMNG